VSFAVGETRLLDRIELTLARGETTILLGPNGAGKSLTLRLAHGLLTPTAGVVEWAHGEGFSGGRKRHAMVFQKPVMLRRSLLANLVHAAASAGMGRREARAAAQRALVRFGFEPLARRPARLMSGGEQQRLAVARAWALDPQVLFLDEPTSQLDPTATRAIEEMLVAMAAEGRTLVMATHDLGQARRLATRVVFLHRGRVLENAEAGAFFANPATREARAFLAGELTW
jgi:tungstate transport system ATP-binding protein